MGFFAGQDAFVPATNYAYVWTGAGTSAPPYVTTTGSLSWSWLSICLPFDQKQRASLIAARLCSLASDQGSLCQASRCFSLIIMELNIAVTEKKLKCPLDDEKS
jgi:hypothetical protein